MIIVFFAWVWLCGTVCITAPIVKRVWTGQVLHKVSLCLFMVYPTISKTVLQMWAYSEYIEGRQYLMVDLRLSPSDDNYPYWFSVAFVFFCGYVLGIPLFVRVLLLLGSNHAAYYCTVNTIVEPASVASPLQPPRSVLPCAFLFSSAPSVVSCL